MPEMATIKSELEEMVSVMKTIADFEFNLSLKELKDWNSSHPAYRAGYSAAYSMAAYRIKELLSAIDNLPVG